MPKNSIFGKLDGQDDPIGQIFVCGVVHFFGVFLITEVNSIFSAAFSTVKVITVV
jgi:hypothetical protein